MRRRCLAPATISLIAALAVSCGRVHPQREGSYALSVTETIRDECNLESSLGTSWEGTLFRAGNIAWFQLDDLLFGMQLVGNFKENVEQFKLDGSVANIPTAVNGASCLLDEILIHLDGISDDPSNFHGTMRVRYVSPLNSRCVCELWASYRAVH